MVWGPPPYIAYVLIHSLVPATGAMAERGCVLRVGPIPIVDRPRLGSVRDSPLDTAKVGEDEGVPPASLERCGRWKRNVVPTEKPPLAIHHSFFRLADDGRDVRSPPFLSLPFPPPRPSIPAPSRHRGRLRRLSPRRTTQARDCFPVRWLSSAVPFHEVVEAVSHAWTAPQDPSRPSRPLHHRYR